MATTASPPSVVNPDNMIFMNEDIKKVISSKVQILPQARSVRDVINDMKSGRIQVQPDFQRYFIWKVWHMTALVDTILRGLGITEMWLFDYTDTQLIHGKKVKSEVIDGQQRMQSLFLIINNAVKFSGFDAPFEELNGLYFKDLPEMLRERIYDYSLRFAIVKEPVDGKSKEIKKILFYKLNYHTRSLKKPELRNCLYWGHYNDLLKFIAQKYLPEQEFSIYGRNRFNDVNVVVQIFSLLHGNYGLNYHNEDQFLDDHMQAMQEKYEKMEETQREMEFSKIKDDFKKSVELCKRVFGEDSFLLPHKGETKESVTVWKYLSDHVSDDMLVIEMYTMMQHLSGETAILQHAKTFKEEFGRFFAERYQKDKGLFKIKRVLISLLDEWKAIAEKIINGEPLNGNGKANGV